MRAKPASQQRSQDKRDQILRAMDTLLRRRSFEKISLSELARQARVSPATIYQRFSNLDAAGSVLLELYYQQVEQWSRRPPKKSPATALPLFEALLAVANGALEQVAELGHVMAPAYLYSRQHPDRVGADWSRIESLAVAGFEAFLRIHAKELRVRDLPAAAHLLFALFNLMMLGPLLHARDRRWKIAKDREAFARELAVLSFRYLTHPDGRGH